jgi:hypothetical protein
MKGMVKAKWAVNFLAGAKVLVGEGDKIAEGKIVAEEIDQTDLAKNKKLISPISGKVSKVDKDRVVIEFEAEQFLGKEICGGKTWGICDFKEKENFTDLCFGDEGKVILVSKVDQIMILKAEAIGVKGILVAESGIVDDEIIESDLPILMFALKDWEKLMLHAKKEEAKVWLSSANGKLLVVR